MVGEIPSVRCVIRDIGGEQWGVVPGSQGTVVGIYAVPARLRPRSGVRALTRFPFFVRPLCSTALVPRHQAARQATAPIQKNRCITDRTEWTHPIQDPPSMVCTLCGFHCSHLAQFHHHATEEHRSPPAHLHLALDSSDEDTRAAPARRRADQPGKNQQDDQPRQ